VPVPAVREPELPQVLGLELEQELELELPQVLGLE
jgi:hypothetical protein